tara:strand:+ start:5203 stop:5646 length:444 start_codon:yes stop_codon:yes gene_type:complete
MEIILLSDIDGLGTAGDIVKVKPGFARNKLIPEGLALRASKKNLAIAIEKKQVSERRKSRLTEAGQKLVDKISKLEITISAQVGDDDKMFGSITNIDIKKALEENKINIDRNSIILEEPIKSLGIYHIPIIIDDNLSGDLKVYVIKA